MSEVIIRANNGLAFYCTVYEVLDRTGEVVKVDFENCQSTSTALADFDFRRAHEDELVRKKMRVVHTAPCVGVLLDEETGDMTL